uniref:Uncharacterized protein n=1 Tax=Setaria italica TaxID=4555 RepID=K3Z2Q4_SETIT
MEKYGDFFLHVSSYISFFTGRGNTIELWTYQMWRQKC